MKKKWNQMSFNGVYKMYNRVYTMYKYFLQWKTRRGQYYAKLRQLGTIISNFWSHLVSGCWGKGHEAP